MGIISIANSSDGDHFLLLLLRLLDRHYHIWFYSMLIADMPIADVPIADLLIC